jgi:CRISPR system Cascade subunit CasC
MSEFIQIHYLQSFSGALLNRDDSGLSKRLPYGGTTRTRVSSQCLKRHWRMAEGANSLLGAEGAELSFRTKNAVIDLVRAPHEGSAPDAILDAAEAIFTTSIYGDKGLDKKSRQPLLFGEPEIRFFSGLFGQVIAEAVRLIAEGAVQVDAKKKEILEVNAVAMALKEIMAENDIKSIVSHMTSEGVRAGGLAGALFGRMVTSDPAANIDASIHVAHAFTVHAEESEADYFTAIDDLAGPSESGAGHVGETELTSGLYYGYVVIDVAALVANLTGMPRAKWREADLDMTSDVIRRIIHQIAEVSPGAKKGSTAPYGYAHTMLIEIGDRQPRSLSGAFRTPVSASFEAADRAMANHLARMDEVYGSDESRRFFSLRNETEFSRAERGDLTGVAAWAAEAIRAEAVTVA